MIKIEVTGNSIAEVSDKLLAIGASLQGRTVTTAPIPVGIDAVAQEVAEAATENPIEDTASAPELSSASAEEPSVGQNEATPPAGDTKALDFDTDVAPLVLKVVKDKGKPVVQQILEQFGVERASLLASARWPELVEQLEGAL